MELRLRMVVSNHVATEHRLWVLCKSTGPELVPTEPALSPPLEGFLFVCLFAFLFFAFLVSFLMSLWSGAVWYREAAGPLLGLRVSGAC